MLKEAKKAGLALESHLIQKLNPNPLATLHNSRRSFYRVKKKFNRPLEHMRGEILIHQSVKQRWENNVNYRPKNLQEYLKAYAWATKLVSLDKAEC